MKTFLLKKLLLIIIITSTASVMAQSGYTPAPENLEARKWFRDAKFGLFIHWGIYSIMGGGGEEGIAEWIMERKEIPIARYEKLAPFFDPEKFDAREWVRLAKSAGMKYITITSKHHDGFAMYESDVSDYNIVEKTPYGKDVLKQLSEACEAEGLKLFFYYSQLDWHHPDYFPRGRTGNGYTGRPNEGNWPSYIDYMNAQLRELLTNYGTLGGIWFDGMWDKPDADWQLTNTYQMIHELQPQVLIGSNHHQEPFPGEDFQMFEKDLPGHNTTGWQSTFVSDLPLETAETINNSWGFNLIDTDHKSKEALIRYLVKAAGYNSNFLLNVGPMPDGKIQKEHIEILKGIGDWLSEYGETIYGTRGGPLPPATWGVTTQKDDKIYLHILNYPGKHLLLEGISNPKSVKMYSQGRSLEYESKDYGLIIDLPVPEKVMVDMILEVTLP